jgi:hypothetical protein
MRLRKLAFFALTFLTMSAFVVAQEQPSDSQTEKDKKKKALDELVVQMLDQAVMDAGALRLPLNRAIVFAIAGDLLWKYDEKRARDLFRNSGADLVNYDLERERERRENTESYLDLSDWGDPRSDILPLVAKRDAEMALELLLQTRSAKLTEAIRRASLPNAKQSDGFGEWNPDSERVKQELALEQQFALLAADENPEKAIKLIKESLSKGISVNVLALLQKLNKKDDKKAASLAGDVIKKLVDSDLEKKMDDMRVALNFLQFAFKPEAAPTAKEKAFAFSESQIKELANKVASTLLQPSRSIVTASLLSRALPMLEKFVPDKAALLRQRMADLEGSMPPEFKRMQEQQKIWDANTTPEDMLAQIPKMQNEYEKSSAYSSLANKIAEIDDEARAKKLIDQIPDEKARTNIQEAYESARISRSASAGKLDDARKMIGNLTKKKTQIQRLVALAMEFQKKGGEKEIATAKGLMKDARTLTSEYGETSEEINDLMEVVKGYAVVDPDIAFRMFEPMVDQINDYVQASSVLARFDPQGQSFKKGELVMKVKSQYWDMPLFRYIPQMQALGKADLERMSAMSDKFARPDSRAIVKLYVLQGFLKDDKKVDPAPTPNFYYY